MEFLINGQKWKILIKTKQELINKYNSEHEDKAVYAFGVTIYSDHEIWINEELCPDQKQNTLRHELAHCFIWSYGLYNTTGDHDEAMCDLISASNEFIYNVVHQFKEESQI